MDDYWKISQKGQFIFIDSKCLSMKCSNMLFVIFKDKDVLKLLKSKWSKMSWKHGKFEILADVF